MPTAIAIRPTQGLENVTATAARKPDFRGVTAELYEGNYELFYTVRKGDTLTGIAARIGTDVESLVTLNMIENPDQLYIGQKLRTPTGYHVIQRGDTYWGIAQKLGFPVKDLQAINTTPAEKLIPGKEIYVPTVTFTPEQKALRAKILAEVKEGAKGEGRIWFAENAYTPYATGNDLGYWGPAESGQNLWFSDDFKRVKVSDASGGEKVLNLEDPVRDTRRLLVSQQLQGLGYALEEKLNGEKGRTWKNEGAVIKPGKDGGVSVVVSSKKGRFTIDWNERTGAVVTHANGKKTALNVTRTGDVGVAVGKALGLKLPLYGDLFE